MTTAWVPLASVTLSSTASSVTFGSIPAGFRDLILVQFSTVGGTNNYTKMRVNSDSSTSYNCVNMHANTTSVYSTANTYPQTFPNFSENESSTQPMASVTNFMDYSATDKHKILLTRTAAHNSSNAVTTRWMNTAAINEIALFTDSSSFNAGSTFSLYGSNRL